MAIPPKKLLVIDGGIAMQIQKHVSEDVEGSPLWTSLFNFTNPQAVIKAHLDFLNAGSDFFHANTYQASVEGFMKHLNLSEADSIELIKSTVRLAHEARSIFLKESGRENDTDDIPKIVASIGAYGAHLNDGSEYTGSYATTVSPEDIKDWHRVRLNAVVEAGVDAVAIETIPCLMEAVAMAELMRDEFPTIRFWISFQCKNTTSIANGEKFAICARTVWNKVKEFNTIGNVIAIGMNCVHPKNVTSLLKSLNGGVHKDDQIPVIVYSNSGENYTSETGWTGRDECVPLDTYIPEWFEYGTRVFGGCCRTDANDVKLIKDAIKLLPF